MLFQACREVVGASLHPSCNGYRRKSHFSAGADDGLAVLAYHYYDPPDLIGIDAMVRDRTKDARRLRECR